MTLKATPPSYQEAISARNSEAAYHLFEEGTVAKLDPDILESIGMLANTWGISRLFSERMPNLIGKEFVFLFDDSGSMRNVDQGAQMSRWMELQEFASSLFLIRICDSSGYCI
jgi:hypothetical protein